MNFVVWTERKLSFTSSSSSEQDNELELSLSHTHSHVHTLTHSVSLRQLKALRNGNRYPPAAATSPPGELAVLLGVFFPLLFRAPSLPESLESGSPPP